MADDIKLEIHFSASEWRALTAASQADDCPIEVWARGVLLQGLNDTGWLPADMETWRPIGHSSLTHGLCVALRRGPELIEGTYFYHDDGTFRRFGEATVPAEVKPTHFRFAT